jgi:DNA polymerase III delta prime subunit
MAQSWLTKYFPERSDELIGNKPGIASIKTWLDTYQDRRKAQKQIVKKTRQQKDKPKSNLLVMGNHGVGKSVAVKILLEERKYEIHYLKPEHLKSKPDLQRRMNIIGSRSDVLTMMHNKSAKKIAVVVDEVEILSSTTEKTSLMFLLKKNDERWYFPLFLISNNHHNKLLSDIKKNSYEVEFFSPYDTELTDFVEKIVKKEKMNIKDDDVYVSIVEHSQYDLRRLIYILQDLQSTFGKHKITEDMFDKYKTTLAKKDVDISLFDAAGVLLNVYNGIMTSLKFYETEKVLLPLMMHQNYISYVLKAKCSTDEKFRLAKRIAGTLSRGDVVENYIYGDQNWDLQEVHGFNTCILPSYLLHLYDYDRPLPKLFFAADLNKTSIRNINRKNIQNASKCFEAFDIKDYIYMIRITHSLLQQNKLDELAELMANYNPDTAQVDSLLKIDKIQPIKPGLSSKQKKQLDLLFNPLTEEEIIMMQKIKDAKKKKPAAKKTVTKKQIPPPSKNKRLDKSLRNKK